MILFILFGIGGVLNELRRIGGVICIRVKTIGKIIWKNGLEKNLLKNGKSM
jgi:hypothetical protein